MLGPLLDEVGQSGGLEERFAGVKGVRSGLYLYNGVLTSKVLGGYYGLSLIQRRTFSLVPDMGFLRRFVWYLLRAWVSSWSFFCSETGDIQCAYFPNDRVLYDFRKGDPCH